MNNNIFNCFVNFLAIALSLLAISSVAADRDSALMQCQSGFHQNYMFNQVNLIGHIFVNQYKALCQDDKIWDDSTDKPFEASKQTVIRTLCAMFNKVGLKPNKFDRVL